MDGDRATYRYNCEYWLKLKLGPPSHMEMRICHICADLLAHNPAGQGRCALSIWNDKSVMDGIR